MTQPSVDPVPSISEAEAIGATKAIYEDFKAVTGVPVVNLIFRHIATLPGCLEWSWAVLRPLYASGAVATSATHLMDSLEIPAIPRLPHAALRAVGIDAPGEAAINRILDAYNRSNPMNLIALTTLLAHLSNPDQATALAPPAASLPTRPLTSESLPPLIAIEDMNAETRTLAQMLNSFGAQGETRTMASMYRQLAHWPGYLAISLTLLHPLHQSGQLQRCVSQAQTSATRLAQELLTQLVPTATPPPGEASQIALQTALSAFTSNLIVEMLPVGKILRAAQPSP
ncbi:hypothetical protein [Candidatus Entotheonella palauensis]|uniref:hypothetical protein n=1 Tax=Candidatus Entotheonella palauensis TaxID=93172 RepID=UPI000B7E7E7A|nr:hypothetical protein [Candidatus Entotheonella palauensis]